MKKSTLLYEKFILLLTLLLLIGGFSVDAWGQTYNSTDQKWYSLDVATAYSTKWAWLSDETIHNYTGIFVPIEGSFIFDSKLEGRSSSSERSDSSDPQQYDVDNPYSLSVGGKSININLTVSATQDSRKTLVGTRKYWYNYTYNYTTGLSVSGFGAFTTSIEVKAPGDWENNNHNVYIQNVKVPMAKHIRLDNNTTAGTNAISTPVNLGTAAVGQTSATTYKVELRSFLMGTTQLRYVSNNEDFVFDNDATEKVYTVLANSFAYNGSANCALTNTEVGNQNLYEPIIYFKPKTNKTGASNATITIYDGNSARATIAVTANVIPTYYFKATAVASAGDAAVKASFVNNFEGTTAIATKAVTANATNVASLKETAYFYAPTNEGDYYFQAWYDNAACTGDYVSQDQTISYEITSSALSEASPAEKTYYAKYQQVIRAEFYGEGQNLMVDGYYDGISYMRTSADEASTSSSDGFWYEIRNNTPAGVTTGSDHASQIISYDPSTKRVTAHNAGTAILVLHQNAVGLYEARDKEYTFTVYKYNSVFANVEDKSVKVGADIASSYTLTYSKPNAAYIEITAPSAAGTPVLGESNSFYYTLTQNVTTDVTTGSPDASLAIAYNASTKTATGKNAGTGTIHLYQPETYKYNAADEDFVVTVTKNSKALTCSWGSWSKDVNFDSHTAVTFSSNNDAVSPIVVTPNPSSVVAAYDGTNHEIVANHRAGTVTWTVSQAEDYKYEAAESQTLTVNVGTEWSSCDVVYEASEHSMYWLSDDDYELTWSEVGVADSIYFQAARWLQDVNASLGVQLRYGNNSSFTNTDYAVIDNSKGLHSSYDNVIKLNFTDSTVTGIRFYGKGAATGNKVVKELHVIRKKYIDLLHLAGSKITSPLAMPTKTVAGAATTAQFKVHYSTCDDEIKLTSTHPHITFGNTGQTSYKFNSNHSGIQTITLTYTSTEEESIVDTITVYTASEHRQFIVTAQTLGKLATTLEYIGAESYSVDHANIVSTDLFQVRDENGDIVENPIITLTSGNTVVIGMEGDNTIDPLCSGSSIITASYAGDGAHEAAANLGQSITINKIDDDVKILIPSVVVVGDEYDLATLATAKSESEITYWSSNESVLKLEGGKLTVLSKGSGSATLRATSAGNCVYNSGVEEVEITIRRSNDPCNTLLLDSVHKANLGAYDGNTLLNPKKYVIADGPKDILTYKVWKVFAATQDIHIIITTDAITGSADILAEILYPQGNILKEIVYYSSELPTSKDNAINESVNMKEEGLQNAKYIYAYATDDSYILAGTLYKYVSNVKITQQCYLRTNTTSVTMSTVTACGGTEATGEFTVDYSDLSRILMTSIDGLRYEVWNAAGTQKLGDDFLNDCGDYGTYTVKLFYSPQAGGDYSHTLTLSASGKSAEVTFSGTANKPVREIVWTPSNTTVDFNSVITMDALVRTGCENPAGTITYTASPAANVEIDGANVTFKVAGPVTITANASENTAYANNPTKSIEFTVNAIPVFEYTGEGGWEDDQNWSTVPTGTNPDIIVSGSLTINENIAVGSLTIENTGSVVVVSNGTLTVNGESDTRSGYGDLHVLEDGVISLGLGADLKVHNFTLDAALSGTKGGVHQNAASGQVANPTKLDVRGEAYFVLTIDPADALTYGWYDFTVPFEVEISNGIYRYGENTPMRSGVDFMIMEYSESRRASGMKGWVDASGTLQPGRAYTITLDKWAYTTYVFKKKTGASTTGTNSFNAVASDVESQTRGWNGLGNGSLSHAQLTDAFSNAKVQLYDHAHNVYVTKEANESNFAVGTAFFIQVSEAQTIPFAAAEENRTLMAPSREVYTMDEFRLTLKDTETDNTTDRLWLSASEEATEEYVIGQDLLKMGTPTSGTVAQMWTMKGGKVLCDVETAMNGERATAPLSFYAPKAGQYELAIDQAPEDVTLYLTYNDQVIWILSFGSYVFDLEKGTTEGYGLRMETNRAPQIATGIDEQTAGAQNRKVMINNTLYIVTAEGAIFDVMGKNIK